MHRSLPALVSALLTLPASVHADPIQITSGSVEAAILLPYARVSLAGDDFLLALDIEGFSTRLALECTPCIPGSTVDLSGSFDHPRAGGHAVVDGVTYDRIFADDMTGTLSTGKIQLNASGDATISLPFTFTAVVNGYLVDPFVEGFTDPVFTKMLMGSGTATAFLLFTRGEGGEPDLFTASRIRYDFGGAESVPEPGTLVLLSAAAAALVRARENRRPRHGRRPAAIYR